MPQMPKWIGDAVESLMSNILLDVMVTETEMLSKSVKRVRFNGHFSKTSFQAGYAVAFRASDTAHRNYTPVVFDKENGICDIIIHLHGKGPGSVFASELVTGKKLMMVPPRGRKFLHTDTPAGTLTTLPIPPINTDALPTHLFFGDETSLGLYTLLAREITASGRRFAAILELDEENREVAIALLGNGIHIVQKDVQHPGLPAQSHLSSLYLQGAPWADDSTVYLTGNGHAIQAFRKTLKALSRTFTFKTETYWIEGKKGL